jgi:hypothetical protein
MAEITGQTKDGYMVEMSALEVKRCFATKTIEVGQTANLAQIYNKLIWLKNNITKFRSFSAILRNNADNLDAALDLSGVEDNG